MIIGNQLNNLQLVLTSGLIGPKHSVVSFPNKFLVSQISNLLDGPNGQGARQFFNALVQ